MSVKMAFINTNVMYIKRHLYRGGIKNGKKKKNFHEQG